ncbi:alpha/beta hydrolase family protein [Nocardia sp. alder85J]|uniref:alpha/beta hydrolase family protein n=1 Tax=Nocardia sp. alder85J TaxID=2862949 RepID=UPI001CD64903|nr:alpha/beta hydrolase [Nocardia sp. alder85J]MCX4095934.1 alpha/beta hydrolase [Nocardia sp. alder85J]
MSAATSSPGTTIAYGAHPDQVADLYLPPGSEPAPLVLLLHGGNWQAGYDRAITADLAGALAATGHAVANIEYRRVGDQGGWPSTFLDVGIALDILPNLIDGVAPGRIDRERIVYAGHSAGGQLALWAAMRDKAPLGFPWKTFAPPRIAGVVALAPVADLAAAYHEHLGAGAVAELLGGGPTQVAPRYAAADPITLGRPAVPTIVVHGDRDDHVPIRIARDYCAKTGTELVELPGIGHFEPADPASAAWPAVADAVRRCVN